MAYPTSLDSFTAKSDGQPLYAAEIDAIYTALAAIETALGTTPQGPYASVAAAITALRTAVAAVPTISPFLLAGC